MISVKPNLHLMLFLAIFFAGSQSFSQNPESGERTNPDMMELARQLYFDDLPFPKEYTPGKFTAFPAPAPGEKRTFVDIDGPGIVTRMQTTQVNDEDGQILSVYVDGNETPVLYGRSRTLAATAQKLSTPAVPWGGFLDGKAVNIYLPIPFNKHLRIEVENDQGGDGPYWYIDYKIGVDPGPMAWKQVHDQEGMRIVPADNAPEIEVRTPVLQKLTREVDAGYENINVLLDGAAVIRKIRIKSDHLDKFTLRMAFDGDTTKYHDDFRTDNLDFQVNVPLKYFISEFRTAGVERNGDEGIIYFPMPFKEKALLQLVHTMDEVSARSKYPATITIEYEQDPPDIEKMYYFCAGMVSEFSKGYQDFEVINVRGEGHFIGINLFDSGHDHGGAENIFFDAGEPSAGQLHGTCGEDYFHHAYFRHGVNAPYISCPACRKRCRHHIEMPVPFSQSFTFNWGIFAGLLPKAVGIWYQKETNQPETENLTYQVTGPFLPEQYDQLVAGKPLPEIASPKRPPCCTSAKIREFPRKTWPVKAQNGFVDLCHASRIYTNTTPPSGGAIETKCCFVATTRVWVEKDAETEFITGSDDPVKIYLGNRLIGENRDFKVADPFEQFTVKAKLKAGINEIMVVTSNAENTNWWWNGFSLVVKNDLSSGQMIYTY